MTRLLLLNICKDQPEWAISSIKKVNFTLAIFLSTIIGYGQFNASISFQGWAPLQNNHSLLKTGLGIGSEISGNFHLSKPVYLAASIGANAFSGAEFGISSMRLSYLSLGLQTPFKIFGIQNLTSLSNIWYQGTWVSNPSKLYPTESEKLISRWRHHGIKLTHVVQIRNNWCLNWSAIHLWSWENNQTPYTGQTFLGLGATYFIGPLTREKNKKTTDAQPLPSNEP